MVWVGVLAGGWGKRLGPLTSDKPKPLLKLAGKRIIDYTLEQVKEIKPSGGVVIVHPKLSKLEGIPDPLRVVAQDKPGLRAAIKTALSHAEDDLIVLSFTGYLARPNKIVSSLLEYYSVSKYQVVMTLAPVSSGLETFGFVRMGISGKIEEVTEHLEEWRAGRGYVFAGALVGKRNLLTKLADKGFIDGISALASEGIVGGYVWEGDWLEIAYPWDLLEAPRLLVSSDETIIREGSIVSPTARIGRGVIIERGASIGDNVSIHGPAYIGRNVIIGDNTVIGPGTIIESDSYIASLSVINNSIIFEKVRIDPGAVLEGGVIGEGADIPPHVTGRKMRLLEPPEWAKPLLEGRRPRSIVMGPLIRPYSRKIRPCQEIGPLEII